MSIGCLVDVKDVVVAKDSDGEFYYIIGEEHTDPIWSFDDYHEGKLWTWHRNVSLGDKPPERSPADCLERYIAEYYSQQSGESMEDYYNRVRELWRVVLDWSEKVNIITDAEYKEKFPEEWVAGGSPYVVLVNGTGHGYELSSNNPDEMVPEDLEWIFEILRLFSLEDYEVILEHIPDVAFYKVYMYDHSGYSFSLDSFNDPWDSGTLGCFLCTKEEFASGDSPDWKKRYREVCESYLDELNLIERGCCWGFTCAPAKKVKESCEEVFKQLTEELTKEHADAISFGVAMQQSIPALPSSFRDWIKEDQTDSCWGFIYDSYDKALEEYLECQMGLEFVTSIG